MLLQKTIKYLTLLIALTLSAVQQGYSQNYLHTQGKIIVDPSGSNFIIRSIGTGNWMLQEGYMMKSGSYGTQHAFRQKLVETIGETRTDSFYNVWLKNHMTRADIDSMKAWGFNTIRPALHYKWFTPPIEEESVPGEITWLNRGFEMVDSLLSWCAANEMYVILDMHGTPGGQGTDANISDYDSSKPSLWESQANKDKLIALWKKLAERYSNEPWIGGYDLINEPNWEFSEEGNAPLWDIYQDITAAIREVDTNHMIIIEGNWFANDYNGLPALWDDNLVLSFHKYWTYNNEDVIQWMLDLRNQRNAPIWLGESGENSNTWFANAIGLCESKNIGWSWWPIKKAGVNNILRVKLNSDYDQLMKNWNGEASALSSDAAFQAVLTFADNHRIENCHIQYDVIDAMIRQPKSFESKPFKQNRIDSAIYFTDYDLGRNGVAYFDMDTGNYRLSTGEYVNWNQGGEYRNDGVDIQTCSDNYRTNGYNVGWTEKQEWLQYTFETDSAAAYTLEIRSAALSSGSVIHFEVEGEIVSKAITLPTTGAWDAWSTTEVEHVMLPAGKPKVRVHIDKEGSNLNYFTLSNPVAIESLPFEFLLATTKATDQKIRIILSENVDQFEQAEAINDFKVWINDTQVTISNAELSSESDKTILLEVDQTLLYNQKIEVSYSGSSVQAGSTSLESFTREPVINNYLAHLSIPGKIEAEDFSSNNGFEREECIDFGEGYNMGHTTVGDYLDYLVYVSAEGRYKIDFRLASVYSNAEFELQYNAEGSMSKLATVTVNNTGGWQEWQTQSAYANLAEGLYTIRILVKNGEFNINWLKFEEAPLSIINQSPELFKLYPNPARNQTTLSFINRFDEEKNINILDSQGKLLLDLSSKNNSEVIDTSRFSAGIYYVLVKTHTVTDVASLIIN